MAVRISDPSPLQTGDAAVTCSASSIHGARVYAIARSFVISLLVAIAATAAEGGSAIPQSSNTAKESSACPSTEFTAFFRIFSQRADLQQRYTSFPLEYGVLDTNPVTNPNGDYFKTRKVSKFNEIPQYRPKSGSIFPSKSEIRTGRLKVKLITSKGPKPGEDDDPEELVTDPDNATATVFLPETAFRVHYRFRRTAGCWFLFVISDRST